MNLVTSASEAIADQAGEIEVTTRCVTVEKDMFAANGAPLAAEDYVELLVFDTGCGMSLDTRASMFDPFFTTKSAGGGLGLVVVQGIVRSLHGTIHIASEPGKGTAFRVWLPCSNTAASSTCDTKLRTQRTLAPLQGRHPIRGG
jgi:signal transduction histidine kinase